MIVLTNARTLLRSEWIDASDAARVAAYIAIAVVWAAAVVYSVRRHLAERDVGGPVLDKANHPAPKDEPAAETA
jgi:hypothetical protein